MTDDSQDGRSALIDRDGSAKIPGLILAGEDEGRGSGTGIAREEK